MVEINHDVIYIRGAQRGAIYNFTDRKVYSVNDIACDIIEKFCKKATLNSQETAYIAQLEKNGLLQKNWVPRKYSVPQYPVKLKTVWLEITNKCNLRCVHCYEGNVHSQLESPLTLEQWKNLIDQIVVANIERIIVIGGEPCCSINVKAILSYLAKRKPANTHITFFTNATLLSDDLIELISANNFSVKVSIYGSKAEIHDTITQVSGSFDRTIASVRKLVKKGVQVNSAVIAMKENQSDISNIKDFVTLLGMNYTDYDVIRNVFGGSQAIHAPDNNIILNHCYFSSPNFYASKAIFHRNAVVNSCWYGKLAIAENGDVFPCEFERTLKYGNVKISSLEQILASDILRSNWHLSFDHIDECRVCEYRYACKDCRPLAISIRGSLIDKNPRCGYNPYTGKWSEFKK